MDLDKIDEKIGWYVTGVPYFVKDTRKQLQKTPIQRIYLLKNSEHPSSSFLTKDASEIINSCNKLKLLNYFLLNQSESLEDIQDVLSRIKINGSFVYPMALQPGEQQFPKALPMFYQSLCFEKKNQIFSKYKDNLFSSDGGIGNIPDIFTVPEIPLTAKQKGIAKVMNESNFPNINKIYSAFRNFRFTFSILLKKYKSEEKSSIMNTVFSFIETLSRMVGDFLNSLIVRFQKSTLNALSGIVLAVLKILQFVVDVIGIGWSGGDIREYFSEFFLPKDKSVLGVFSSIIRNLLNLSAFISQCALDVSFFYLIGMFFTIDDTPRDPSVYRPDMGISPYYSPDLKHTVEYIRNVMAITKKGVLNAGNIIKGIASTAYRSSAFLGNYLFSFSLIRKPVIAIIRKCWSIAKNSGKISEESIENYGSMIDHLEKYADENYLKSAEEVQKLASSAKSSFEAASIILKLPGTLFFISGFIKGVLSGGWLAQQFAFISTIAPSLGVLLPGTAFILSLPIMLWLLEILIKIFGTLWNFVQYKSCISAKCDRSDLSKDSLSEIERKRCAQKCWESGVDGISSVRMPVNVINDLLSIPDFRNWEYKDAFISSVEVVNANCDDTWMEYFVGKTKKYIYDPTAIAARDAYRYYQASTLTNAEILTSFITGENILREYIGEVITFRTPNGRTIELKKDDFYEKEGDRIKDVEDLFAYLLDRYDESSKKDVESIYNPFTPSELHFLKDIGSILSEREYLLQSKIPETPIITLYAEYLEMNPGKNLKDMYEVIQTKLNAPYRFGFEDATIGNLTDRFENLYGELKIKYPQVSKKFSSEIEDYYTKVGNVPYEVNTPQKTTDSIQTIETIISSEDPDKKELNKFLLTQMKLHSKNQNRQLKENVERTISHTKKELDDLEKTKDVGSLTENEYQEKTKILKEDIIKQEEELERLNTQYENIVKWNILPTGEEIDLSTFSRELITKSGLTIKIQEDDFYSNPSVINDIERVPEFLIKPNDFMIMNYIKNKLSFNEKLTLSEKQYLKDCVEEYKKKDYIPIDILERKNFWELYNDYKKSYPEKSPIEYQNYLRDLIDSLNICEELILFKNYISSLYRDKNNNEDILPFLKKEYNDFIPEEIIIPKAGQIYSEEEKYNIFEGYYRKLVGDKLSGFEKLLFSIQKGITDDEIKEKIFGLSKSEEEIKLYFTAGVQQKRESETGYDFNRSLTDSSKQLNRTEFCSLNRSCPEEEGYDISEEERQNIAKNIYQAEISRLKEKIDTERIYLVEDLKAIADKVEVDIYEKLVYKKPESEKEARKDEALLSIICNPLPVIEKGFVPGDGSLIIDKTSIPKFARKPVFFDDYEEDLYQKLEKDLKSKKITLEDATREIKTKCKEWGSESFDPVEKETLFDSGEICDPYAFSKIDEFIHKTKDCVNTQSSIDCNGINDIISPDVWHKRPKFQTLLKNSFYSS